MPFNLPAKIDWNCAYRERLLKISVVIPTFNNSGSITQTVRSVLCQSHSDLEVIVVNDGGTSPRDLLPMKDPRLRLIECTENAGVSVARNAGFADVSGHLVYFVDSDDVIGPGLFRYAVEAFADRTEMDALALGRVNVQDETEMGNAVLPDPPVPVRPQAPVPLSHQQLCHMFEHVTGRFIPSAVMMRTGRVRAEMGTRPWLPGLVHNQDTLFFLEAAACGFRYYDAPDPWLVYRRHAGSLSQEGLIGRYSDRMRAMDHFGSLHAGRAEARRFHRLARKMRHNAARRVARAYGQLGCRRAAHDCLLDDFRAEPTLKTGVALLCHWASGVGAVSAVRSN